MKPVTRMLVLSGSALMIAWPMGCATDKEDAGAAVIQMPVRTTPTRSRALWASSYLYAVAPELRLDKWLTEKPDLEGKFVILEFWRTWCSACKKGTTFLNEIQKRYPDNVVVIGVTAQSEDMIANYSGPKKNYYLALDKAREVTDQVVRRAEEDGRELVSCAGTACGAPDTLKKSESEQGVTEAAYGVFGWPHVVILEPTEHVVVWEGFPAQPGYELTEDTIRKCIAIHATTTSSGDNDTKHPAN